MSAHPRFRSIALRSTRSVRLVSVILSLCGCTSLGYHDAGPAFETFQPLTEDMRVRYAPGAQRYAQRVAVFLPAATAQIEALQYRAFRTPPAVNVCNDQACFDRFVAPEWNYTAAVVYDNHLVLAPRLFTREPERMLPILLHELSHVHMGQYRGHYTVTIPVWFHEGLASLVAAGGGADLVNDADAQHAASEGRHFAADEQHVPWQRKRADAWGITTSIFYRQAMLYVAWLRASNEHAFHRLLRQLQDGAEFEAAFAQAYQTNPAHSVRAYLNAMPAAQGGSP